MPTNLSNLLKPKKRRSGLSWIRLSGRIQALSFAAVFAVVGAAYLVYTHAASRNDVAPAISATPSVSVTPTPSSR